MKGSPPASTAPAYRRALALGILLLGLVACALWVRRGRRRVGLNARPCAGELKAKRVIDVVGSLVTMALTLPWLPVLALLIKLDSPGPVFFVQERAGKDGRPFRIYKLRSMIEGADAMLGTLVDLDTLSPPVVKLKDDPRVTRFGRFLRRTSLDELPQLVNVLRGDMSLVGPRPEETRIVRLYNDWHRQRLAVKPGITGPMQVSGRADLDFDRRVELELEYIRDYSVLADLGILLRTLFAVISGKGAY
jgi:lipopolysaccharide/colanic/teichoic acid biosynthesis glycosyltransferase